MKTKEEILEAHFGSDYYLLKERDDLQYILRAMEEYAILKKKQLKRGVMQGLPYYQLCPKCFGEGYVHSIGSTSSLHRTCPVCNGAKTLYHPPVQAACASGAVDKTVSGGSCLKSCSPSDWQTKCKENGCNTE